jgi:hypothetical protein
MKLLILALPCAVLLAAGSASAASVQLTAPGTALGVDDPCAKQITIEPDPALKNKITLQATADHTEELAQLVLDGGTVAATVTPGNKGTTATLHTTGECWRPGGAWSFNSTLVLAIHVPAHTPISLDMSGSSIVHLGAIAGPLNLSLSGSSKIRADSITSLALDMSGSGEVDVGRLDGKVGAQMSGSGGVSIASGTIPELALEMSGSGDLHVSGAGNVGKLKLDSNGSGNVQIDGTVGDAALELAGSSGVRIGTLTGSITQDVSGSASVQIGKKQTP